MRKRVFSLFASQLKADGELDASKMEVRKPTGLSLAAKFAPSEGGQHSRSLGADKEICRLLYPDLVGANIADGEAEWPKARAKYRRLLSSLRRALVLRTRSVMEPEATSPQPMSTGPNAKSRALRAHRSRKCSCAGMKEASGRVARVTIGTRDV